MELPEFGTETIPRLDPGELDEAAIELQLNDLPHLDSDRRYDDPFTVERIFSDVKCSTAAETLARIPKPKQASHLIINGRFALWDFVPAILKVSGTTIDQLYLATLGFSRKNIQELSALVDSDQIKSVALLCSHYFLGTSNGIYEYGRDELAARNQRFASCRTHCKIVLAKLTDKRCVTIESSANLRSCKNLEQVVIAGDPGLYNFHARWLEELFP